MTGRELITQDEVRMLDNRYAIVFILGERPVMDEKYDITHHPNFSLNADGGAEVYRHGEPAAGIDFEVVSLEDYPGMTMEDFPKLEEVVSSYVIYDEDSVEQMNDYLKAKKEKSDEKKKKE